jgi:Zn-dependent protease
MLQLLAEQQYLLFISIIIALIISLTFHEYGHGIVAKLFGDNTAEKAGRLTLNPIAHIDPMGLLMVVLIGFGYAKPVPTNPANYKSFWATLFVAAAGPAMNLILAIITINVYQIGIQADWGLFGGQAAYNFFTFLGPYFLPRKLAQHYYYYNHRYGSYALLGLVVLNLMGVPIFRHVWNLGQSLLPIITFV